MADGSMGPLSVRGVGSLSQCKGIDLYRGDWVDSRDFQGLNLS